MPSAAIDWTSIWLFLLTCALGGAGWWVKRVDRKLDSLEGDIASLRVNGAGSDVRALAGREHLERIERKLDRIDEKLDGKADKSTCTAFHNLQRGHGADD